MSDLPDAVVSRTETMETPLAPALTDVESAANKPLRVPGKLPALLNETPIYRWVYFAIAVVLVIANFAAMHVYWAPAHPGVDQNGYLVGGKMFAKTFSTGFTPANPYQYVGTMWVENGYGRYYPKYPLGLSVLDAITLKIGGAKYGIPLTFMINPIAMALAMLATFMLLRLAVGSFYAVLGMLIVATSSVTIGLTNNPNSHATAICCVAWGMYLLVRWWQSNGFWRAIGAGFLLGMAVTIRYTEGMELLPIALVVLLNLRWKKVRSWAESAALLAAWAVPVVILVSYNWVTMHTITGYDPTNESTGFSWDNFTNNWETMVRQICNSGLFFIIPFSLLGMVMMWKWNWKFTAMLFCWIIPSLVIYTAYYWAPDNGTIMYLRFYLTIFPALALAAVWSMKRLIELADRDGSRILPGVAVAIVLMVSCGVSLNSAMADVEVDAKTNLALQQGTAKILKTCPSGSTIFAQAKPLNFLQLAGDYDLYDVQQFTRQSMQRFSRINERMDQPSGLQPQRAEEMFTRLSRLGDSQLLEDQNKLMTDAISGGHRVFMIYPKASYGQMLRFLPRREFTVQVAGEWDDWSGDQRPGMPGGPGFMRRPPRRFGAAAKDQTPESEKPVVWQILEVKLAPPPPVSMTRVVKKSINVK
jgi:Dolichyl-phosphate-mannose-protein mannosyltransferase